MLVVGVLTACEKSEFDAASIKQQHMDPLEVYLTRVAEEGIALLGDVPTRSGGRRVVDPSRIKVALSSSTRSGESDTLFYVVNFADSAGFALIDADTTSRQPLFAVTEKGNYTPGEVTNTGFDDYMAAICDFAPQFPQDGQNPDSTLLISTTHEYYTDWEGVNPMLEVKWGQDWPYNEHTPIVSTQSHALVGCIATAMAQVLSYYEYPDSIELFYNPIYVENDTRDTIFDVLYPNWEELKNHNNIVDNDCLQCDIAHIQLPYLMRELGYRVNMQYSPTVSGAYISDVDNAMIALGYSMDPLQAYDWSDVTTSLFSNKLVYAGGYPNKEDGGHAWVIDGYKSRSFIRKTEYINPFGPTPVPDIEETEYNYVHINWGWDGRNNGYFLSGVFDTASPYELDEGSYNVNDYSFSYGVKMYTNITRPL